MKNNIKARLLMLGMTQLDLIKIIREKGYPKLQASQFSSYLSGNIIGPQADSVLQIADNVLAEKERKQE